jgi:hypothetical protein
MAKTGQKTNHHLLQQISSDLSSVSREVSQLRAALKEAHKDIIKLNMIEEKIKKGEEVAQNTSGWFWWQKEMPT